MKPFYVTSPIFYPNAQPHLGHAYATLICDVLVRHKRLEGFETYFLTGTDEHTEKIIKAAEAQNQSPEEYLEEIVARFKDLYASLGIEYDQFIRTSDRMAHWPGVIEMWDRLVQSGDLYKGEYVGLYCIGCEAFKTEKDLVDGLCPDHGVAPERIAEENYFFRLSNYAEKLEELINSNEIKITPANRKLEILNFIRSGLQDVSFSRPKEKMTWGVPVPNDESQTMYIWMDALTSYLSALGFGRGEENMRFWPGTHVIGKDILRFHSLFWPAMLLSAGLPLPKEIFVHGTIISGGQKMSKTLGNVIDPVQLVTKYGVDATRYLLLRHVHPTEDTDITQDKLDEWYTANLVNGLGNLVARVMKLAEQYLPNPVSAPIASFVEQEELMTLTNSFSFNEALSHIFVRIGKVDSLMTEKEPFKKIKLPEEHWQAEARDDITRLVADLAEIAEGLEPFMPDTSQKIREAIASNKKPGNLFPRLP